MIGKIRVFNENETCDKIRNVEEQMIFRCIDHIGKINKKKSQSINCTTIYVR